MKFTVKQIKYKYSILVILLIISFSISILIFFRQNHGSNIKIKANTQEIDKPIENLSENMIRSRSIIPFIPGGPPEISASQYYLENQEKLTAPLYLEEINVVDKTFAPLSSNQTWISPILVLVDSSLINTPSDNLFLDLLNKWKYRQNVGGHDVVFWLYRSGSPENIKNMIRIFYEDNPDLYFVWFVGDIPASTWIWEKEVAPNGIFEKSYPSDIFYMDLDSICLEYKSVDNIDHCVKRTIGNKIQFPIARLPIGKETTDPTSSILHFLEKDTNYDIQSESADQVIANVIGFDSKTDDGNYYQAKEVSGKIISLFGEGSLIEVKQYPQAINKFNNIIQNNNLGITIVSSHSNNSGFRLNELTPDFSTWYSDNLFMNEQPTNSIYFILRGCEMAYYLGNSIGLSTIYSGTNTFGVLGSTSTTFTPYESDNYLLESVALNGDFVKGLKEYYNPSFECNLFTYDSKLSWCNTDKVFLGDPTIPLRIRKNNQSQIIMKDIHFNLPDITTSSPVKSIIAGISYPQDLAKSRWPYLTTVKSDMSTQQIQMEDSKKIAYSNKINPDFAYEESLFFDTDYGDKLQGHFIPLNSKIDMIGWIRMQTEDGKEYCLKSNYINPNITKYRTYTDFAEIGNGEVNFENKWDLNSTSMSCTNSDIPQIPAT